MSFLLQPNKITYKLFRGSLTLFHILQGIDQLALSEAQLPEDLHQEAVPGQPEGALLGQVSEELRLQDTAAHSALLLALETSIR